MLKRGEEAPSDLDATSMILDDNTRRKLLKSAKNLRYRQHANGEAGHVTEKWIAGLVGNKRPRKTKSRPPCDMAHSAMPAYHDHRFDQQSYYGAQSAMDCANAPHPEYLVDNRGPHLHAWGAARLQSSPEIRIGGRVKMHVPQGMAYRRPLLDIDGCSDLGDDELFKQHGRQISRPYPDGGFAHQADPGHFKIEPSFRDMPDQVVQQQDRGKQAVMSLIDCLK